MHDNVTDETAEVELDPAEIYHASDLVAVHGPFRLRPTSVEVDGAASFDQWEAALQWCQQVEQASPWWVGDLIELGEAQYGEKYAQALDHTTYTEQALRDIAYVARNVAPSVRRAAVSFSHHREVAALPPSQQETWLHQAETDNLTQAQLRTRIKVAQAADAGTVEELWLIVRCESVEDQDELADRLRGEGRSVKAAHGKHGHV
jgi:hypothetical protein